jgi:ATP-GRASP peptide maturase of grasp-with-spasm system
MILIMSDENDSSTSDVITWLNHFKMPFFRINIEDAYSIKKIQLSNEKSEIILTHNNIEIDLCKIKSFWYRRGGLNIDLPSIGEMSSVIRHRVITHLQDEFLSLVNYFNYYLSQIPAIGAFKGREANKFESLFNATIVGLKIPNTLLTMERNDLEQEFQTAFITKGISQVFCPSIGREDYITYTKELNLTDIPNTFFSSLFQEKIIKHADIRIFYLNKVCYSMAILSQNNVQTEIDFRKYDRKRPNRCVPFKLPIDIEIKLSKLMEKCNQQTGSIDMVLDTNGEFYFLEINPVGQYGMTSIPCNYYLDKIIAQSLIELQYE